MCMHMSTQLWFFFPVLLEEEEPPFYFYWFLIACFCGLPLLGNGCWKNVCSFCPGELYSHGPPTWGSPDLPSPLHQPSSVLLGFWLPLFVGDLLASIWCLFQLRQFQIGRDWEGEFKEKITSGKEKFIKFLYSVLIVLRCFGIIIGGVCCSGGLWEFLLPAVRWSVCFFSPSHLCSSCPVYREEPSSL